MREIMFRAWDGKFMIDMDSLNEISVHELYLGVICDSPGDGDQTEIKVMQYTGLKDKNGKEIFDGDIVRVGFYDDLGDEWIDDHIHEIQWFGDSGYPAFDLYPNAECDSNGLASIFQGGEGHIEVIGNIYENPDLLEASCLIEN